MVLRDMTLENPIRAIREISHDITCTPRVRLANGREATALEIQSEYLTRALRYAETHDLSPQREAGARDVGARAHPASRRTRSALDRECDWVIKHNLIEAYREQARPAADPPARSRCSTCSTTTSTATAASSTRCSDAAWSSASATDADIDEAVDTPPQTTRARLRGEFIRRAKERKRDYTVDWVHLKLNDQAQRTVLCKDPFKSHDERVEKLIASL